MTTDQQAVLSKVPEVTLIFWIIKILATTLGETGGDAVSMSLNLGYLVSTGIFAVLFLVAFTGPPSSPLPPWAPRWQTSPLDHSASVMRVAA